MMRFLPPLPVGEGRGEGNSVFRPQSSLASALTPTLSRGERGLAAYV